MEEVKDDWCHADKLQSVSLILNFQNITDISRDDEKAIKCEVMFTMKATSLPEFPASFKFCSIFTVQESDILSVSSVFKCFEKAPEQITPR